MKRNWLSRMMALMLSVVLVLGCVVLPASAEEDAVVIKLHYNRPDGVYDGWSVWFWVQGKDGAEYPFETEGGEMTATFPVPAGATSIGFIVKLPNWAAKDVDKDQFIDVAQYLSGTVHVYVESGVEGYTLKEDKDVVKGIKVREVSYEPETGIQVAMTAALSKPSSAFTVTGPDGQMEIDSVGVSGDASYVIKMKENLDLVKDYSLIYDGVSYPIRMPNIYSMESFEAEFTYEGNDLGATWAKDKTTFRLWAPTAASVKINLYQGGTAGVDDLLEQVEMTPDVNGTWVAEKSGDLNGVYYTYQVEVGGQTVEACDPYARTTGVNGQRAMIIDLASTNPEGWENDTDPHAGNSITDAVIYELHVRDLSMDDSSGITNKGKYLGLIETGTTNSAGIPTGLDHIKNLGVTHLHILPMYDYASVDESKLDVPQFNWGYDPQNYNVPEGSYSTDPFNGAVRVAEMKQMIKGLHDNGISVIMDVVYNHVYSAETFCFNKIVPQYFSRVSDSGVYSSGSGCGNDTATERSMVRKYIVDSVKYWVEEYHIDGFRFDLVGLMDTETINAVVEEVHKTHPNVIFYGEGWTMTTAVTKPGYTLATQVNSTETPKFAYFSDNIRDAIRGNVFNNSERGYVSNVDGKMGTISASFRGMPSWSKSPTQTVNYASCHDNMTLFDRLTFSNPEVPVEDLIRMNNLSAAIVMTSQGIPFFQAGEEMLRSKPLGDGNFDHNSYASPDSVNSLKWDNLNQEAYQNVYAYYQGLIAFRQAHPALRMTSAQDVAAYITNLSDLDFNVTGFRIAAGAGGEWNDMLFIFNPTGDATTVTLPAGNWNIYVNGEKAGTEVLGQANGQVSIAPISAMVLVEAPEVQEQPTESETQAPEAEPQTPAPAPLGIIGLILAAAVLVVAGLLIRKKKNSK